MEDKFHDECGVFGIYNHSEAANITYLGLQTLQHRGQESSGIVSTDGKTLYSEISMGKVADIYTEEKIKKLKGAMAVGHNRYSTAGFSHIKNAQPIVIDYFNGSLAISHNGNITNASYIRRELEAFGSIFSSTSDSEVMAHLIAKSKKDSFLNRILEALRVVEGAFSVLIMSETELIAARDPFGFRPLSLGKLNGSYVVASETCAFDLIGAEYLRDIEPGEAVLINKDGVHSYSISKTDKKAFCIFELIYFSRPDSNIFGQKSVYKIRKMFGVKLSKESHVDADIVIPVPDSGVPAALGYAESSGIPFEMGLIRSHYVGRTFIEPEQSIRNFGVKLKLSTVKSFIKDKRIVVIDDSIVRGTTSKKLVKMFREAGASEVHLRISSPPVKSPCYFGIDTPTKEELIANKYSISEMQKYLNVDSLAYLSIDGMLDIFEEEKNDFCLACFDGNYPIDCGKTQYKQLKFF